jgi:ribonuclease Z
VLFTHLHSDHVTDFADLRMMAWTGGRTTPLPVYGPAGTGRMVRGFQEALAADTSYRLEHHQGKLPAAGAGCEVREVSHGASLEIGDIAVSVAQVDHGQVKPALAYRFDRDGRAAVVSGDTRDCSALPGLAKGADLLVCCAQNRGMMDVMIERLRQAGNVLAADLLADTRTYLASPLDAARMAQAAGVRHLVLSHLTPPIPNEGPPLDAFVEGMSDIFAGAITVGRDLQRFAL